MPGLVISVGGKLEQSFQTALKAAGSVAQTEIKKQEQAMRQLQQQMRQAEQSRSPAIQHRISQEIEKTRLAIDATTRAHLAENAALEAKYQAYKKNQAAAFAAQGQTAYARTNEGNQIIRGDVDLAAQNKINAYLRKKKEIMGATGSGMAPGFSALLAKEKQIISEAAVKSFESMNGSGGFGWTSAGSKAGGGFMRGFLSRLSMSGTGMSQIVSVVSNTLSSAGSGMSWGRILAQQAPNLIQGGLQMGKSFMLGVARGAVFALPSIGAEIINYYARKAGEAADQSNRSNLNLASQTFKLSSRNDDILDNLVKSKVLTAAQADNYRDMMHSHEGLLRVQKELMPLVERMNSTQKANGANVAQYVARSTAAREALETIQQGNWTQSQIRNDLAAREKGLVNLRALMAKTDASSPEVQRMQAKLDEENLAIAQDRERLKSGSAPARMVSERERIGLGASSSIQVSILEVARKTQQTNIQQLAAMQNVATLLQEGL